MIDDSVVRLNNAPYAAQLLKEKGAEWVTLVLGTPVLGPVIGGEEHGCLFGVDMPPGDEFAIQKYKNLKGIRENSGFDDIYFISNNGLAKAHGVPLEQRCTYCIGGPNPVPKEEIENMKKVLYE